MRFALKLPSHESLVKQYACSAFLLCSMAAPMVIIPFAPLWFLVVIVFLGGWLAHLLIAAILLWRRDWRVLVSVAYNACIFAIWAYIDSGVSYGCMRSSYFDRMIEWEYLLLGFGGIVGLVINGNLFRHSLPLSIGTRKTELLGCGGAKHPLPADAIRQIEERVADRPPADKESATQSLQAQQQPNS